MSRSNKCVLLFHLASSIAATFVRSNNSVWKSVSCVTFFSESLEPILIAPRPLVEQFWKEKWMPLKILCFGRKREPEELNKQKNKLSQRAESYFFALEAVEVKRAGWNEKIARFDLRVRSSVEWNIREKGFDRACLCFLCFTHCFNDLICYLSDLLLPNWCRKFSKIAWKSTIISALRGTVGL